MMDTGSRLISLNLVYDYPVRWSRYVVLRDFVQNFYDSIGWRDWSTAFDYTVGNSFLTLTARNVGFSYEWLVHIGASTKREDEDTYAGYFGEGFKMAALCAVRDYGWSVHIASRDWEIEVTQTDLQIEERVLKSLAYSLSERTDPVRADTVLRLSSFHDHEVFESVRLGFFYPENPLFGEEIWRSENGAVYKRSRHVKPSHFPVTSDLEGSGMFFTGYQVRGSIPVPLIFCLHYHRDTDRDRRDFFRVDLIPLIADLVMRLPAPSAARVLEELRCFWRSRRGRYSFESWWIVIENLVRRVAACSHTTKLWTEAHPYLLTASKIQRREIVAADRRRQALAWLQTQDLPYRLVQDSFQSLGYPSLEDACQHAGGFTAHRPPRGEEIPRLKFLQHCVAMLFPELEERIPASVSVFDDNANPLWGLAVINSAHRPYDKVRGFPVRYVLSEISLNAGLLLTGDFAEIFATYLHEVAHMFGRDESVTFSRALTYLIEAAIRERDTLAGLQDEWLLLTAHD